MPRVKASERDRSAYEAAWLHYKCGLSQQQIAERLQKDKSTVSRWLADAHERGLVTILLRAPTANELAACLEQAFGLTQAQVCVGLPAPPFEIKEESRSMQLAELGRRAAETFGRDLKGKSAVSGIGLGGGRGIAAFAESLRHYYRGSRPLQFSALSVSSREPFHTCAATVTSLATSLLARHFEERAWRDRLRGREASNDSPSVEGTALRLPSTDAPESMAAAAERYYDEVMGKIQLVLTGIGQIETCYILDTETGSDEVKHAQERGAVGEILYEFFGEHGVRVDVDIAAHAYSFGIRRLQQMVEQDKEVVVICSGKTLPTFHALMSDRRFVTGIVTDEATGQELLDLYEARRK